MNNCGYSSSIPSAQARGHGFNSQRLLSFSSKLTVQQKICSWCKVLHDECPLKFLGCAGQNVKIRAKNWLELCCEQNSGLISVLMITSSHWTISG